MKLENEKFLDDNEHFWITLRDAGYCKGLSAPVKDNMMRIMREEFSPNYVADLWCPPCIAEMIKMLYNHYERYKQTSKAIHDEQQLIHDEQKLQQIVAEKLANDERLQQLFEENQQLKVELQLQKDLMSKIKLPHNDPRRKGK